MDAFRKTEVRRDIIKGSVKSAHSANAKAAPRKCDICEDVMMVGATDIVFTTINGIPAKRHQACVEGRNG